MRERITVHSKSIYQNSSIRRVPFDKYQTKGIEYAWVRYRGGRLFVSRPTDPALAPELAVWRAYRFEPKVGNGRDL